MRIIDKRDTTPTWDLSQERAFVETLVGQRLNFLLVFYAIIAAGALNARVAPLVQAGIFLMGGLICLLLSQAVARAQKKLDLILGVLFNDPKHPAAVIDRMAGKGSRRKNIGYAVPFLATSSLFLAAVLSFFGLLNGT